MLKTDVFLYVYKKTYHTHKKGEVCLGFYATAWRSDTHTNIVKKN